MDILTEWLKKNKMLTSNRYVGILEENVDPYDLFYVKIFLAAFVFDWNLLNHLITKSTYLVIEILYTWKFFQDKTLKAFNIFQLTTQAKCVMTNALEHCFNYISWVWQSAHYPQTQSINVWCHLWLRLGTYG